MIGHGAPARVVSASQRLALFTARLESLEAVYAAEGGSGLLLTSRRDFAWLTVGGLNHVVLASEQGAAPVLVTRGRALVLAPVNEAPRIAEEELADLPIDVEELPWWDGDAAERAARAHVRGRLVDGTEIAAELLALRQPLNAAEHGRLSWLGALVRRVVDGSLDACEPGWTEHRLAAEAQAGLASAGARTPVLLVAADERIDRFRHPLPGDTPIRRRAMLVVVAERWGLHAALTGIRHLEPPPPEERRGLATVAAVLRRMREETRPGRTLGDVVQAARDEYARLGYADEWRLHHQGGTIGYGARERIAAPDDDTVIVPGMAFAWNPSVRGAKAEATSFLDEAGSLHVVTG